MLCLFTSLNHLLSRQKKTPDCAAVVGETMEEKSEAEEQSNRTKPTPTQKVLIQIPSYQDVIGGTSASSSTTTLFQPSQTFSQAFAFIKNTEFYSPPPQPPPSESQTPPESATQSGASSSSASAANQSTPVQTRNSILVSHRQKGNPLLKHIRNVRWTFADVVGDYVLGQSSCALYLRFSSESFIDSDAAYSSLPSVASGVLVLSNKGTRKELQASSCSMPCRCGEWDCTRIILQLYEIQHHKRTLNRVQVAVRTFQADVTKPLLEVTKTALLHDCTLLCAWSLEECGRYLETIKMYENKSADLIQGQMDTDYLSRLQHALTSVRRVNKTDVVTLGSTFGVKRLHDTFHEPFKRTVSSQSVVSETTTQGLPNGDQAAEAGVEKEEEQGDANKRRKKESEKTVKSTLSAVLAKYADKFGKKNERTIRTRSKSMGSEGAKSNSKEGDSS
ncbi:DNA excision repair protein ERCC-1 [Linum perenne]